MRQTEETQLRLVVNHVMLFFYRYCLWHLKEAHHETISIVLSNPKACESQSDRQLCCRVYLKGLIIVSFGKVKVIWKSKAMFMHVTKVEHCLCIGLGFRMHVGLCSPLKVPLSALTSIRCWVRWELHINKNVKCAS